MSRKFIFKRLLAFALLISVMLSLAGCISVDTENKDELELRSDGQILQRIVDDVDSGITGEELEEYTTTSIKSIQTADNPISLEKCRVKNDKVNLSINYGTTQAYSMFNNVRIFNGTLKEAYDAGYDFNRTFKTMNGVEIPYFALIPLCTDCKVFIVEEPVTVKLPGELLMVSDGVTVGEDGTIRVEENPDTEVPGIFQTTTLQPVFMIYKSK